MNKFITICCLIFMPIQVFCQTGDFTYQSTNGLFCAPSTIQFTHTSSGNPTGFIWSFGNNSGSNSPDPAVIYAVPGAYTVKLVLIFEQTTVTVSKTIVINPSITASLAYDRNYICKPGLINFTATSSGNIASCEWNFNDGSPIVVTSANTTSHTYAVFGSYYPTLKVTDVNGCSAATTVHIVVESPQIFPTISPTNGCIPANVSLSANVIVPATGSVTGYTWNFGDGSPAVTTTTNNTTHVYSAVGNYMPSLNIVTNEGCTNTSNFPAVAYGTPPTNHIAYPKKPAICGSETAQFVSKAVDANSYFWDFGDGVTATVTDTIAQHRYTTLGTKTVTVTPSFNGCAGTVISFTIDVEGVIAGYTFSNSCSNPKQYAFSNTSQGNLSLITWNFGDGSPVSNSNNAIHSFPATGSFTTSLTVLDNITGCTDSYSRTIYTANPSLVNTDSAICKNSNTTFTILNNYNNATALYTWHVAGMALGPYDSATITVNANILGNFNNNFVVIDNGPESCPDTIQLTKPILVKGPNLNFTSPNSICLESPYIVSNTSQPYIPGETINNWNWAFGIFNDTSYQPLPFSDFLYPGTWDIQLTAIDINGCKDSLHKILTVNPIPFVQSIPGTDTLCLGQTDTLIAFHSNSILWSPAAFVNCTTCDTVIVNPNSTTYFYVTASNNFNCSIKDSVLIKVYTPFTAVAVAPDVYTCMNDPVQLNVGPQMQKVIWSPATGLSDPNIYNPIASPANNTSYTALISDSVGCFSSSTTVVVHVNTLPTVNAGPDMVYPYNTAFVFSPTYSNNVSSYLWSPATTLDCSNCPFPNGIARVTQTYTLTVSSDSGCIAKDYVTIFVECKDANLLLPGAFSPNGDNINDYFYPMTRGIRKVTGFSIYNRQGQLVFERRDFDPNIRTLGWDGKLKGSEQPAAAYIYTIEVVCEVGEILRKKGSFVLIR